VSLGLDFWADALSLRGYVTLRGTDCPALARWIIRSYAACRPGSRPSQSPWYRAHEGRGSAHVQIGGQEGRGEVTLIGPMRAAALVPALPQRLRHELAAAMTELRAFGAARGDFEQGAARARPRCVSRVL
jgi:hypothetical protein